MQYHGQTLQLFPGPDRTSYARSHVEVQERLDGQILVCHRGKVLTPKEAPPLAATLRHRAMLPVPPPFEPEEAGQGEPPLLAHQPKAIWYEDTEKMSLHRELTRAGVKRAREQGKRIGRPRVSERPEFEQRFAPVAERVASGNLSCQQGAKELAVSYGTLKRLLDARLQSKGKELTSTLSGYLSEKNEIPEDIAPDGYSLDKEIIKGIMYSLRAKKLEMEKSPIDSDYHDSQVVEQIKRVIKEIDKLVNIDMDSKFTKRIPYLSKAYREMCDLVEEDSGSNQSH